MTTQPAGDDDPRCRYEGFWVRLLCPHCDDVFEIEGDESDGEEVTCDACGNKSRVEGR